MRKVIVAVVVVLVVAIVAAAMFVLDGRAPRADAAVESERATPSPILAMSESSSPVAEPPSAAERARPEALAEREAMRRRILDAMHARERAASEREGGSSGDGGEPSEGAAGPRAVAEPVAEARAPEDEPDDDSAKVGTVVDQTGNHAEHVKVVNEELIPLTDECYALARETQPELAGFLVLDFELIGDEEIGGVIESVKLGQGNELVDPGLVECVQESILATTLPPPKEGGRDQISLSLRLSPDEE